MVCMYVYSMYVYTHKPCKCMSQPLLKQHRY